MARAPRRDGERRDPDDGRSSSPRPTASSSQASASRRGHNQALGARGERLAADWYLAQGYRVVARNWRCREGEIDLVVARRGELVFCEVKTRTSDRFGLPAEAVTPAKQRRLRMLATRFLAAAEEERNDGTGSDAGGADAGGAGDALAALGCLPRAARLRFDVAAVLKGRIAVIEGAF